MNLRNNCKRMEFITYGSILISFLVIIFQVVKEKVTLTFSINQITSQGHQSSNKERLKLQSTISANFPSDVPSSVKDVNSSSLTTPNCRKRCPVYATSNVNRWNYVKEMIRSSDKVYNHNEIVADDEQTNASPEESVNCNKSIDKRTCKTTDATSTQAMWFRSQSACNQSENIFGVSYDYLEKAIEKIAENTTLDHQDSTVPPPTMDDKKCISISVDHRSLDMVDTMSSIQNRDYTYYKPVSHGKDLLLHMNRKGNQIPSLKNGSIKETKIKPCQNLSQAHSSSTHWRSNVSNRTASQKGRQSHNSIVQINELLINQKTARTREGSLPTRMLSQTKGRDQRRNAGTPVMPPLTTTLGPTLMRMCTMDLHAKVDKQRKHQPSASQTGNKTARQKDQPHQSIRFTTILDEKLPGRSVKTNYRRTAQKSFPLEPVNVPSNQKAKTYVSTSASSYSSSAATNMQSNHKAKTYVSTSASSYSSSAAQGSSSSESEESIPSRLMTHQRVAPSSFLSPKRDNKARISHDRSMKGSRRMPTLDTPQHVGSIAHMEKAEKRIGRLWRLKNKLGVIFHHHHHHHHHHHNGIEAEVGQTTLSNHHQSVGKYFRKVLRRKSKEGKVKSRLHSGCHKRDADYGLIDGLVRHVWHSKKSKKSSGMKGLGKSHKHKMKVKKWHWWQNVSKHKGVVRQTNNRKRRFRLRLKAQKKHLRALKPN